MAQSPQTQGKMIYKPDVSKKAQYKSMTHLHHLIRKILLSCLLIPGLVSAMTIGQTVELGKLETFAGTSYSLPANNTKNTLVMIWASWCPFCQRQNVYLEKFVKQVPPNSINIITISIDKNPKLAKDYMSKHGYTFQAAMMTPELNKSFGKVKGVPIVLILDKNNKIIHQEMGEMFEEDFADLKRFAK